MTRGLEPRLQFVPRVNVRRVLPPRFLPVLLVGLCLPVVAGAQDAPAPSPPERLQPRDIGTPGTMFVGFGGHVDRTFTSERETAFNYTAQVEVGRFITRHIVVEGGVAGSGQVGGGSDEASSEVGAAALHAFGGALWYFTPRSLASIYTGAEYWAQLTRRPEADAGAVLAKIGLQGALSARASLFVEGGYGLGLTRNDEGMPTRVMGRVGLRVKW